MNGKALSQPEASAADAAGIETSIDIRHLSPLQLAKLGMTQIAYVKPIIVEGAAVFGIHAADGTPMAVAHDRNVAIASIHQNDMIALAVH